MPHGNEKGRVGRTLPNTGEATGISSGRTANPAPTTGVPQFQFQSLQYNHDDDERGGNGRKPSSSPGSVKDSTYVQYKTFTQRFKDALQSMVPATMFHADSAYELVAASEFVAKKKLLVTNQLWDDLNDAIRIRKIAANHKYGGGDTGHVHYIKVLKTCRRILKRQRQVVEPRVVVPKVAIEKRALDNRFHAVLPVSDETEDTDEDDLEDDLPLGSVPRPDETGPTRLSLKELIEGTDRMDTIVFLMTLDELMRFVSIQYVNLKEASAAFQEEGYPPDAIVEIMMEASVATNFAIQQVAELEQIFIQDHPHLSTVYRALANLVMVEPIQKLTEVVSKNSPIAAQFSEKDAVEFVGDVMECAFRNPSDPQNKRESLVDDFRSRWQFSDSTLLSLVSDIGLLQNDVQKLMDSLPTQQIQNESAPADIQKMIDSLSTKQIQNESVSIQSVFEVVELSSVFEVPIHSEKARQLHAVTAMLGHKHHSWLDNHTYIGKDRSITHTIRLVQILSSVINLQQGQPVSAKNGMFGPSWTVGSPPFSKIQIEMDALLMEDILPPLIGMCYGGLLSHDHTFYDELLTMFLQIKSFVNHPESTVSWSLAFTVHSILTAVFEVQGSTHLSFLAETACVAFEKYGKQIDRMVDLPLVPISRRPPIWDNNVRLLRSLQYIVQPRTLEISKEQQLLFAWNPLCAGTFLSYIAYFGNLEGGMSLVDSVAQLRVTLHLYNALLQAKAISRGQVELIDWVFDAFKDSKAMWEGELPTRGQYVSRGLIVFGMKANLAAEMQNAPLVPKKGRQRNPTRDMTPIEPKQLSKSFRRICLRDFSDVVDIYHTECMIPREGNRLTPVYRHAVRVNDTLSAMEEDGRLLATNFVVLGHHLNQFYLSLFNVGGWMPLVEQKVRDASVKIKQDIRTDFRRVGPNSWEASDENLMYQTMHEFFVDRVLRPLDAGDALVASRCAEFMVMYYVRFRPESMTWFTPVEYSN